MNDDLESQLRAALRPEPPPKDLTDRVLARLAGKHQRPRRMAGWLSVGLAASVLLAIGVYLRVQGDRETAQGLEARREVLQALRLTHQKLDIAYRAVREQTPLGEETS